jgi:hypothetical protein
LQGRDLLGHELGGVEHVEAEREGIEIMDDVDVVNVVDAHLAYFDAIGAVGPRADVSEVLAQPELPTTTESE